MNNKTKKMTFTAMMIALSGVLSFVPIPGFPTLAFDALPGYFVAIFVNPVLGGVVALFGHLLTAMIHGLPLSLPGHLLVAISMFVAAYTLGKIFVKGNKVSLVLAIVLATVINIYLSMPLLIFILGVDSAFLLTLQIPLLIASLANILLAVFLYFTLTKAKVRI